MFRHTLVMIFNQVLQCKAQELFSKILAFFFLPSGNKVISQTVNILCFCEALEFQCY